MPLFAANSSLSVEGNNAARNKVSARHTLTLVHSLSRVAANTPLFLHKKSRTNILLQTPAWIFCTQLLKNTSERCICKRRVS